MTRISFVTVAVALVLPLNTLGKGSDKPAQPETRLRYSAPQPGQERGWIELQQYNLLPDPVEAGRILMAEAQLAGVDLDDSTRVFPRTTSVHLPGGRIASADAARAYIKGMRQAPGAIASSKEPALFLVKLRRPVTVREYATALTAGIRLSRAFSDGAIVMAMRPDQVLQAADLPYVDWIQPFLPEYKYDASSSDANDAKHIFVESLLGDQQVCRNDLMRCGATIFGTFIKGTWYNVRLSSANIGSIAALWWVLYVETGTETRD